MPASKHIIFQDDSKVQLRQQRLAALERLTKFREERFKQEGHVYDEDIVQQMRNERDADIDHVLYSNLINEAAQTLLEPQLYDALADIAAEEERSLTDIFREMTESYLAEHRKRKALAAIEYLSEFRKTIAARTTEPLPDPVDVLNEMEDERMANFERIWRGEE